MLVNKRFAPYLSPPNMSRSALHFYSYSALNKTSDRYTKKL
jgi:hypothetical protein